MPLGRALLGCMFLGCVLLGCVFLGCAPEELADPPSGAAVSLVESGAEWRFLDDGSDPAEGWQNLEFDDAGWSSGPSLLGFGKGDEATVLRCRPSLPRGAACAPGTGTEGTGAQGTGTEGSGAKEQGAEEQDANHTLVYFFRHQFELEDPSTFSRLRLRLMKDDGAVVYLNGREVARSNLRPGHEGQGTTAGSRTETAREWLEYRFGPDRARAGTNILAAEVHLASATNPDLGFDLDLIGFDPGRTAVSRGPYLQRVSTDSAAVLWRTGDRVPTRLRYGTDPEKLDREVSEPGPRLDHAAELVDLEPETRYFYRLEADGRSLASGGIAPDGSFGSFVTAPARDDVAVRVWVLGDPGTGDLRARQVKRAFLDHAVDRPADVWLTLGDNAYDDGTDDQFQRAIFETYPHLLRGQALWPSVGNHDLRSIEDGEGPYYDIFDLPTEGQAGGVASGSEGYYSFDHGPVHFIALDTAGGDMRPGREMLTWLEADLEQNSKPWTVAYFHHPPYSDGWHRTDDTKKQWRSLVVRENILPMLEQAGVDLVLAGHSHSYERSYLLQGHYGTSDTLRPAMVLDRGEDGVYEKDRGGRGTLYVVAGSSGKVAAGELDHAAMAVSFQTLGSVVIDIEGPRLELIFLEADGTVADEISLLHR